MAAEAPDLHQGDLGCLEEVRIALNGADIIGHKESKKIELLDFFALGVGRKGRQYFLLQKNTTKLFSSAIECILQKVIAYVGYPVLCLLAYLVRLWFS